MNDKEFRELANKHWIYTKSVIERVNVNQDSYPIDLLEFLYVEAMIHGRKHALEELAYEKLKLDAESNPTKTSPVTVSEFHKDSPVIDKDSLYCLEQRINVIDNNTTC